MKIKLKKHIKSIKRSWGSIKKKDKKYFIILISLLILSIFLRYINPSRYQIQIFVTIWTILFLWWFVIFDYNNVERFILERFTQVLFWMIVILFLVQAHIWISNRDILFMIGAIFAFWYWYIKYERNKEIETINDINLSENDINNLIIDWHTKRMLYEKRYIKEYIWEIYANNFLTKFYKQMWVKEIINNLQNNIDTDIKINEKYLKKHNPENIRMDRDINKEIIEEFKEKNLNFDDEVCFRVLSRISSRDTKRCNENVSRENGVGTVMVSLSRKKYKKNSDSNQTKI